MAAKDGLIVRLRITGGIVPAAMTHDIADLATRFGNGLFDLSARGNLQMRGVQEANWRALVLALEDLGLVDDDPAAESVRNVMASPLAGLHEGLDIRPLVRSLEAALANDAELHRLPAKFGFLVDDGSEPALAEINADVRFDFLPEQNLFAIGLGGTRTTALRIGACGPDALVAHARRVSLGAIALSWEHQSQRRMRGLIDALGAHAVAAACGGSSSPNLDAGAPPVRVVGPQRLEGRAVLGLAAPFGRLEAAMLHHAAALAEASSCGELRLTPWRSILVRDPPEGADLAALAAAGFIVAPSDPRLDIVACVGQDGCARGTTSTQADAAALADLAASLRGPLHISGCEKGCARAEATPVTLVGRDGCYDLVRDGRARDVPIARGLDLDGVRAALARRAA